MTEPKWDKPGGLPSYRWLVLGVFVGVLLIALAAAWFFTLERRRFARMYPSGASRHGPE